MNNDEHRGVAYRDELVITEAAHNLIVAEIEKGQAANPTVKKKIPANLDALSTINRLERILDSIDPNDKLKHFRVGMLVYADQFSSDSWCYVITPTIRYLGHGVRFSIGGLPIETMCEMRKAWIDSQEVSGG